MVEAILYELNIELKQEQILEVIFRDYLFDEKYKITTDVNQYIKALIDTLVDNELKGTFVQEIYTLTKIIQNYFQIVEQRLFPFGLKSYLIYVDWESSRILLVDPKYNEQLRYVAEGGNFTAINSGT